MARGHWGAGALGQKRKCSIANPTPHYPITPIPGTLWRNLMNFFVSFFLRNGIEVNSRKPDNQKAIEPELSGFPAFCPLAL